MARTKAKTTVKKKASTSTIVRRAKGNAKSSKQGTDNLTFSLSFNQGVSVGSKKVGEDIIGVVPINVYDVMSQSKNYQALASIFEQVRIDYVAAVLTVSNATGIATDGSSLNTYSSYDLYTAWDRNGVDNSELKPIYINSEDDIKDVYPAVCGGLQCITGSAISSYGSVKKSSLNVFQKWRHATWIAPKDLQEKQQFVNCKSIQKWHGPYASGSVAVYPYSYPIAYTDAEDHKTYFFNDDPKFIVPRNIILGDQNGYAEIANNSDNPSLIGNSAKYPFKPTLLIGAFKTGLNTSNAVDNFQPLENSAILLNIEWKIVVTFRGIKGITN